MDVKNLIKEIEQATGWKQEVLADRLHVSQATVSRWRSGADPRGRHRDRLRDLATEVLNLAAVPAELLNRGTVSAPLISWVSAGQLAAPDASVDLEGAELVSAAGLDPKGDWIALRVEGSSMDRISPPESVIFVNRKDQRLVPNACYVIAGEEGEATYKRYRPSPDRWEPVSTLDHETLYPEPGNAPRIIGRVRLSMIAM